MPTDHLIEFDLRDLRSRSSEAQRVIIDQLLTLLRDALVDGTDVVSDKQALGIDELRAAIATGKDAVTVVTAGDACLLACREAVARLGSERLERKQQIRSLLDLMREALASFAAGSDTLQANMAKSADRFQALASIHDPRVLRAKLAEEVVQLKHLAADCKHAWQGTLGQLDGRVSVLEEQLNVITTEASVDALTGIANRRTFERTCRSWMAATISSQFVVAMIDLDNFKSINDTFGHGAGDRLLHSVAHMLAEQMRAEDLVARLGGDEFAILASHLTLRTAEVRIGKILSSFNNMDERTSGQITANDKGLEKLPVTVTLSCGIAEFSAGDTYESLVKRADDALYEAKRQGKHRLLTKDVPFVRDVLRR